MSKEKRQKRFQQKKRHIIKQSKLWSGRTTIGEKNGLADRQPHRFHKKNAFDCGVAGCYMCNNPRRVFGELTLKEKQFYCQEIDYDRS